MDLKRILELVEQDLLRVEAEIQQRVDLENPMIAKVGRHICNSGGKRLRPMLLLLSSNLCNYTADEANLDVIYATSIELIHVATLLHDDVIDESETRRGKASANARWGNKVPVLVGDYLYSLSNVMLADAAIPRVFAIMSRGIMEVSEGQILEDIKIGDVTVTYEDYLEIIRNKTAALFCVCCETGAVLGNVGEEKEAALVSYGLNMGIAFQMMDDVLDFAADGNKLGKPLGNDLREGNLTLPIIRLLERATQAEQDRVAQIVREPHGSDEELAYILKLLERYQVIPAVIEEARAYAVKAKEGLRVFDNSIYREALTALADYVVDRDH